ncbi:MAG: serine/threonine protein kinase [Acidobacteria bacterium]|nr:serine/threonine protein kinase [Acidobacteriota bacterium]
MSEDDVDPMGSALDRATALLSRDDPVDWLSLYAEAADAVEAEALADLQALDQMARLAASALNGPSSSPDDWPGAAGWSGPRRWGPIEIRGGLGRGAYGEVYDGWDTRLAREVALKLFPRSTTTVTLEEARQLARVRHPHVVTVFGADEHDGLPGLWMERLTGRTLDEILAAQGPFSAEEAAALGIAVCSAVTAIHAAGLVHRDIKAQNVMREVGGRIVLLDLGTSVDMARGDTPVGSLAGTPLYMAPELYDGASPNVTSDVYALGVLLYRLVTHAYPIEGRTVGDVRAAHREGTLRPVRAMRADLPADFVGVVERAMASRPADRFQSAGDLERALRQLAGARSSRGPRSIVTWLAGAVAVGVVAGVLLTSRVRQGGAPAAAPDDQAGYVIAPDQFRLLSGYLDLAFDKRETAPAAAYDALTTAYAILKSLLPGDEAIHGRMWAMKAWLRLAEDNVADARTHVDDLRWFFAQSVGEHHPYSVVAAMIEARFAQREARYEDAATAVQRGLHLRRRLLGPGDPAGRTRRELDTQRLAQLLRAIPVELDTDGDGIPNVLEAAVGLDPERTDSDADVVTDQDEDHDGDGVSNLLALGVSADPFLTIAHAGVYPPVRDLWQSRHALRQGPDTGPPAGWQVSTSAQGQLVQQLPAGLRERAVRRGFSLFFRATPRTGTVGVTVDTSPAGPRFDLGLAPAAGGQAVESLLFTDVASRQALRDVHPPAGEPPLFELRHLPREGVRLYRDGRLVRTGYAGHRQFLEGIVIIGITTGPGGSPEASGSVHLVWLEVR